MKLPSRLSLLASILFLTPALRAEAPKAEAPLPIDQLISTGDNHFLGNSIPVDSQASIEDTFEMFKQVYNTKRIYWRGLQEASWVLKSHVREDNYRLATFHHWIGHLIREKNLEKLAVDIAHKKGMEVWGMASLGDWGSTADTPGFNDFPFNSESRLRIENPEWAPVDKYGYRKQGGTIELAYPEARKALIDLLVQISVDAGYDGMIFLTYVENFSQRFQDEFGYSEPIVQEFKKRFGIDIRKQEFTRYASLYDWRKLRGEYVTTFLRELRTELNAKGIKLGMFLNPQDIHKSLIWATLPYDYQTIGNFHLDVDTWVRDGIVDQLVIWGGCAPERLRKTVKEVSWLTRDTGIQVSAMSSNPYKALTSLDPAIERVGTMLDDANYYINSLIPEQTEEALAKGTIYEQLRFLTQVAEKKSQCPAEKILPFLKSPNVLMRRMALYALGATKDPIAIPAIEAALADPEIGVKSAALTALSQNSNPESINKVFAMIEKDGVHPICEMARNMIPKFQPVPYAALIQAATGSPSKEVRNVALRVLGMISVPADQKEATIDALIKGLDDSYPYSRYSAAMGLALYRSSPKAIEALLKTLKSPDAPIADRAALSLSEMVAAGYNGDLKPQIVQGIKDLFLEFGDGCDRSDLEWGHRAVGNALLALGAEGDDFLAECMEQHKDKRLAEMAWQVIYFREKAGPNKFNVITEKENEEAYKVRPPHMKRLLVERISQGFEGVTKDDSASFGAGDQISGRWSALGPKGQFLETQIVHSGTQSVKLSQPGGPFVGRVDVGVSPDYPYESGAWIQRMKNAGMLFSAQDMGGRENVALRITNEGLVEYKTGDAPAKWIATDLTVPEDKWTEFRIRTNPREKTFQVQLNPAGEDSWDKAFTAPLLPANVIDRVMLSATSRDGGDVYVDDIVLIERR